LQLARYLPVLPRAQHKQLLQQMLTDRMTAPPSSNTAVPSSDKSACDEVVVVDEETEQETTTTTTTSLDDDDDEEHHQAHFPDGFVAASRADIKIAYLRGQPIPDKITLTPGQEPTVPVLPFEQSLEYQAELLATTMYNQVSKRKPMFVSRW
jgi:hypothetical protein